MALTREYLGHNSFEVNGLRRKCIKGKKEKYEGVLNYPGASVSQAARHFRSGPIAMRKAGGRTENRHGLAYGHFLCGRSGELRGIRLQPNTPADRPLNNTYIGTLNTQSITVRGICIHESAALPILALSSHTLLGRVKATARERATIS
jgi:hypothetical protein